MSGRASPQVAWSWLAETCILFREAPTLVRVWLQTGLARLLEGLMGTGLSRNGRRERRCQQGWGSDARNDERARVSLIRRKGKEAICNR